MKETSGKLLFYAQEHLSCANYIMNVEEGFHYRERLSESEKHYEHSKTNSLIFVFEGTLQIDCGAFGVKTVRENHVLFIPRNYKITKRSAKNCKLLVASFSLIDSNCNKLTYDSLDEFVNEEQYNMDPLPIKPPMQQFLALVVTYIKNKISCVHIHKMKINEMLMCFRFFYSKQELATLFHPILGTSLDFRNFLLELAPKVKNVQELIDMSNMSKTVFYEKFKEEFADITPKNWLNQRISEKILYIATNTAITVKELAEQSGFDSVQRLQQYCKRYMNRTPSEIIKERQSI